MTTYALERPDGSVAIMRLVGDADIRREIALWCQHPGNVVVATHEIDEATLPSDTTFRNAWRFGENGIRHCMKTAKGIQKERIRARRSDRFAETDLVLRDAILTWRDASAVTGFVRALRDATADPAIEAAGTPEALAQVWPEVLAAPVPSLGDRLPAGTGPAYDTTALEDFFKGLKAKVDAAEEERKAVAAGALKAVQIAQEAVQKVDDMARRLANAESGLDHVMKNAPDINTLGLLQRGAT